VITASAITKKRFSRHGGGRRRRCWKRCCTWRPVGSDQHAGIHYQGFRYRDTTLAAYVGEDVIIRYDPRDMADPAPLGVLTGATTPEPSLLTSASARSRPKSPRTPAAGAARSTGARRGTLGNVSSQRISTRGDEVFAWMKTLGGFRRTRYRGLARTQQAAYLVATAYNLVRLVRLAPPLHRRDQPTPMRLPRPVRELLPPPPSPRQLTSSAPLRAVHRIFPGPLEPSRSPSWSVPPASHSVEPLRVEAEFL
jgi:hypothetical protein